MQEDPGCVGVHGGYQVVRALYPDGVVYSIAPVD